MNFNQLQILIDAGQIKEFKKTARKTYFVSTEGTIYSMNSKQVVQELKPTPTKSCYLQIRFTEGAQYVHRIVCTAFLPNPNNYSDVHHKDFNTLNCKLNNLMWSSHFDNVQMSLQAGNYEDAEEARRERFKATRKLSDNQIREIRELSNTNNLHQIAKLYSVDRATIKNIINGRNYKDVI